MKKIGITGTIASGKTSVSVLLKQRGMLVFNADNYSKMALHPGNVCYDKLVHVLGRDVVGEDGDIDAHKMAEKIFNEEEQRKAVNAIVHPFVKEGMQKFFASHADKALLFAEVPLLYESHWEDEFDAVCVITCTKDKAIHRMMKDRGYSKEEAEKRYGSQMDPQLQMQKADYVLHNDGDKKELDQQINTWISALRKEIRHGN